jgi:hypothetical protein
LLLVLYSCTSNSLLIQNWPNAFLNSSMLAKLVPTRMRSRSGSYESAKVPRIFYA